MDGRVQEGRSASLSRQRSVEVGGQGYTRLAETNPRSGRGERDFKKGDALLRQRPALIYTFIHDHRFKCRVSKMCDAFQVSRSGYYKWTRRKPSKREHRRKHLERRIRRIFLDSRRLYGSPKITEVLRKEGVPVSEKTVM
ncbi:transposase IS3/IS911 family protein [Paenibacillus sabinae T27]|uniref:Transposase IS3/IS911 family protein n=2 Tax=Paenibacillus TaxID=44249 RepID=X5A3E4_9BACL|nr:transposase IS3/IS911 family protein [Paenibacillus sabinae T27]